MIDIDSIDRLDMTSTQAWKDFRDWVRASVELETRTVTSKLDSDWERWTGRRDAYEEVWRMVRAFEQEAGPTP